MGTKNNPGRYDCLAHAEADEPVFVLVARDASAPAAILAWVNARMPRLLDLPREEYMAELEQLTEALHCIENMKAWRRVNRP